MKRLSIPHTPISLIVIACMAIGLMTARAQSQSQHQENTPDEHRLPQFRQHAEVEVKAGGKTYNLSPNELGAFPRIYVQPSEIISVKVAYHGGNQGESVVAQVEDGGVILESNSVGHHGRLDKNGKLSFTFQTTNQLGIYRIVLRKGEDIKQLEFWVGDPQPLSAPVTQIPKFNTNH